MTDRLHQAFLEASKLPDAEQDLLATWLLSELAAEDEFDRAITGSAHKLAGLAREAIEEDRSGRTEPLDPDGP